MFSLGFCSAAGVRASPTFCILGKLIILILSSSVLWILSWGLPGVLRSSNDVQLLPHACVHPRVTAGTNLFTEASSVALRLCTSPAKLHVPLGIFHVSYTVAQWLSFCTWCLRPAMLIVVWLPVPPSPFCFPVSAERTPTLLSSSSLLHSDPSSKPPAPFLLPSLLTCDQQYVLVCKVVYIWGVQCDAWDAYTLENDHCCQVNLHGFWWWGDGARWGAPHHPFLTGLAHPCELVSGAPVGSVPWVTGTLGCCFVWLFYT